MTFSSTLTAIGTKSPSNDPLVSLRISNGTYCQPMPKWLRYMPIQSVNPQIGAGKPHVTNHQSPFTSTTTHQCWKTAPNQQPKSVYQHHTIMPGNGISATTKVRSPALPHINAGKPHVTSSQSPFTSNNRA
ncbi:hypothetical protein [Bifidobacterium sp. ESL0704]|uniref:hypothetical protein n=1 Tax=Bifidobacterium sp. ESL0704 TaxID=2983219 RepID=UPI0023F6A9C6|nr:hypothetical protein [Bifidobacterium sp. ESL0704]WEV52606.1 hypothetical protein OZX64_06930 [Bifidobacterium sp. ESL0704]